MKYASSICLCPRNTASKIYKSGSMSVSKNASNCKAERLYQFLKDVRDRADEMGWTEEGILRITINGSAADEREQSFMDN